MSNARFERGLRIRRVVPVALRNGCTVQQIQAALAGIVGALAVGVVSPGAGLVMIGLALKLAASAHAA